MAISKTQPMREAEIELVEFANGIGDTVEETHDAVIQLSADLARESLIRQTADTDLRTAESHLDARVTLIENNMEHFPVFEVGNLGIEIAASSTSDGSISFGIEKQGLPTLIASLETLDETASSTGAYLEIYNLTVSGFDYTVTNPDAVNSVSVSINWIAIGE